MRHTIPARLLALSVGAAALTGYACSSPATGFATMGSKGSGSGSGSSGGSSSKRRDERRRRRRIRRGRRQSELSPHPAAVGAGVHEHAQRPARRHDQLRRRPPRRPGHQRIRRRRRLARGQPALRRRGTHQRRDHRRSLRYEHHRLLPFGRGLVRVAVRDLVRSEGAPAPRSRARRSPPIRSSSTPSPQPAIRCRASARSSKRCCSRPGSFTGRSSETTRRRETSPLTSWEVASELSYLFWRTMPDAELISTPRPETSRNPPSLPRRSLACSPIPREPHARLVRRPVARSRTSSPTPRRTRRRSPRSRRRSRPTWQARSTPSSRPRPAIRKERSRRCSPAPTRT